MKWKRCYGLEDWTFAEDGKMRKRQMSGNDVEIQESGEFVRLSRISCVLLTDMPARTMVQGRGRCQQGRNQRGPLVT